LDVVYLLIVSYVRYTVVVSYTENWLWRWKALLRLVTSFSRCVHSESKKQDNLFGSITSWNINRSSKFIYCWSRWH